MTRHQGDNPSEPRGRQQSGTNYQQQPSQPPRQQPPAQGQSGPGQQSRQPPQGQSPTQRQPPTQGRGGTPQSGSRTGPSSQGQPSQSPQSGGGFGRQSPSQAAGSHSQQPVGGTSQQPPSAPMQSAPPTQASPMPPQQSGGAGMSPQAGGQTQTGPGGMRGKALEPVTIDEIVATDVVTAQRDTPIATIVAKMAEEDVGSVVVLEDDSPVGVVTDRSIALALENTPDVAEKQAGDLVGDDLVTGTMEMSAFEALDRLREETIRRLPIVDDEGNLEGIVTLDDLVVLLSSELDKAGKIIREQSPRL